MDANPDIKIDGTARRSGDRKNRPTNSLQLLQTGRMPPQATELERVVLGALMLEKDALTRVIDFLRAEVFYLEKHRLIFEGINKLFNNSDAIDIHTVTQQLRKDGSLDTVGGAFYIVDLTNQVASAANIEHHARILIELHLRREIIRLTGEAQARAYDDVNDVFELLDELETQLYELSGSNLRRESQAMDSLMTTVYKRVESLRNNPEGITGIPTGFEKLDHLTAGWQPSDLIILAARPSMGKTAFVLALARNAAVERGLPVAIFSLEMDASQLAMRLLCTEAEIESEKMRRGQLNDQEWAKMDTRIGRLSRAPIYIDDTPALSAYELRAKCRRLKMQKDIRMVIIDYLQLMAGDPGKHKQGNREQEIANISRSLKQLAKELSIPIIALSQLNRSVETRGGDKKPMLSDLRESGSIEQDADMVMFLYRAEYYGITEDADGMPTAGVCEVIIGKQRNGPVDSVKLQFDKQFGRFSDLREMEYGYAPAQYASYDGGASGGYGGDLPAPKVQRYESRINDPAPPASGSYDSFGGGSDEVPF